MFKITLMAFLLAMCLTDPLFSQADYLFSNDSSQQQEPARLYFKLDFGRSIDENIVLQKNDIGKSLKLKANTAYEALIGVKIYQNTYIEAGISSRPLVTGYSIWTDSDSLSLKGHSSSGLNINFLAFPVRCAYYFPLHESPVSLYVFGGLKPLIAAHSRDLPTSQSFNGLEDGNRVLLSEAISYIESRAGLVVNLGFSVTLDLTQSFSLITQAEYDQGLVPLTRVFVKYNKDGGAITNSVFNYASGYRFSAGLQYRLFND